MFCNLFSEYRADYEIMWKNMVEPDRPQMTVWCMGIACWTTKSTDTYSKYEMLIAFHGIANATQIYFYTHIARHLTLSSHLCLLS